MKLWSGRTAGLLSFSWGASDRWTIHLFPRREYWEWGRCDSWYDGPLVSWGFGPLFLLCEVRT